MAEVPDSAGVRKSNGRDEKDDANNGANTGGLREPDEARRPLRASVIEDVAIVFRWRLLGLIT